MNNNDTNSIQNPFEQTGKLWGIFSAISLISGIVLLLSTKEDFQIFRSSISNKNGEQIIPLGQFILKLFSGLLLLGLGVKYIRIALSAIFKFDPDKRLTENLDKEYKTKHNTYKIYDSNSLAEILKEKNLELIKPNGLIENMTIQVFKGLKKIPPKYFFVSQNFLKAVVSSASPFLILFIALFLNYLEIIDVFLGSRFQWLLLLISISVIFSWSPFSPITTATKKNIVPIILVLSSIGTFIILRTSSLNYKLPEIPNSVFLVTLVFVVLSGGIFLAFFYLLKRRVHIEDTNDDVSREPPINDDLDVHPDEIHRVISNNLEDIGDPDLTNRIYKNKYYANNGKFVMDLIQETQPIPQSTLNDSILIKKANYLTRIGFLGAIVGLILFVVLASVSNTFIGLLLSTIASFGIVNFGLKLIHLSNLFLSEFAFKSTIISVLANGEYKSSQLTAGRGIYDSVESKNDVTKSSISLKFISSSMLSVSFIQLGKADPFKNTPRYIVSLNKDEGTNTQLKNFFKNYLLEKSQIVGIGIRDAEKIQNLKSLSDSTQTDKLLNNEKSENEKNLLAGNSDELNN